MFALSIFSYQWASPTSINKTKCRIDIMYCNSSVFIQLIIKCICIVVYIVYWINIEYQIECITLCCCIESNRREYNEMNWVSFGIQKMCLYSWKMETELWTPILHTFFNSLLWDGIENIIVICYNSLLEIIKIILTPGVLACLSLINCALFLNIICINI